MKASEMITDEIRNAEIPMSDRLSRALERVESIEQQRDELLAVMNKALLAWHLDHLSHDPIDLLVEAIDKHKAQEMQHD